MKGIKGYKGPKPKTSMPSPKKFARGMDPITATKKFFLYKDIFGNMSGPPDKQSGGIGNVHLLTAARRMGLI